MSTPLKKWHPTLNRPVAGMGYLSMSCQPRSPQRTPRQYRLLPQSARIQWWNAIAEGTTRFSHRSWNLTPPQEALTLDRCLGIPPFLHPLTHSAYYSTTMHRVLLVHLCCGQLGTQTSVLGLSTHEFYPFSVWLMTKYLLLPTWCLHPFSCSCWLPPRGLVGQWFPSGWNIPTTVGSSFCAL